MGRDNHHENHSPRAVGGGPRVLLWLRSGVFTVSAYLWLGVTTLACLPVLLMPRSAVQRFFPLWAQTFVWLFKKMIGGTLIIEGLENVPAGACIVASKHQSTLETLVMISLLRPAVFILKQELLSVPLFGLYLKKYGMIPVKRYGRGARKGDMAKEFINSVGDAFAQNRGLIIYPEGTRTAPEVGQNTEGQNPGPKYHKGVGVIHRAFPNVPVIPVALTTGVVWPRRSFLKYPGTCYITFLPPVPKTVPASAFLDYLKEAIESKTTELLRK